MSNYSNQVPNPRPLRLACPTLQVVCRRAKHVGQANFQNFWSLGIGHCLEIRSIRSIRVILVCLFAYLLICLLPKKVLANMQSDNYVLQMPNLNYASGDIGSSAYKLGFTGGELAVGPYSKTGYKLGAGFWYIKTITPFSFTVSNSVIEFDVLSTDQPKTASTTLTVSAGGSGGYQVTAEENHEMMVYSVGALIPDITGDNSDITEDTAGKWTEITTYGFGYSLYGNDVVTPFPTAAPPNYTDFKQFANTSKSETPKVIMTSDQVGKNREVEVVYKINISAVQSAGRYQNVITYIATPTY